MTKKDISEIKFFIFNISKDIFVIFFVTFVVFFIFENLERGLVTNYINVNIILAICFLGGIVAVIFSEKVSN